MLGLFEGRRYSAKKRVGAAEAIFDHGWVDRGGYGRPLFVKQPQVRVVPRPVGAPESTAKFVMPQVGAEAEKQSFQWHLEKMNIGKTRPTDMQRRQARHLMETVYDKARWCIPENWRSRDRIMAKILQVKPDGSPGPEWMSWGSANSEVIKNFGLENLIDVVEARLMRVLALMAAFAPLRVFIKQEPTKIKKIMEGRARLIWCFDLIDQVIMALIYDPSLQAEICVYDQIPSQMGLSFSHGAWNRFIRRCLKDGEDWMEMDKTAWDWSVPDWMFEDASIMRWDLCINGHDDNENVRSFKVVYDAVYLYQSMAMVQFSDGVLIQQTCRAIQKSGSKTTISDNSRWQKYLRVLFGLANGDKPEEVLAAVYSMGDDTLERRPNVPDAYIEKLREWGFYPKPEEINYGNPANLNFCSHTSSLYDGQFVPVPTNWNKQLWNLQWKEMKDDAYVQALQSMMIDWAFVPDKFQCLLDELKRVAPDKVRSASWYRDVTLGFD